MSPHIADQVIKEIAGRKGFKEVWDSLDQELRAEIETSIAKIVDDEESDCTDFAHPAWWRGNDAGVAGAADRMIAAVDGQDDGSGVMAYYKLQRLRMAAIELRRRVSGGKDAPQFNPELLVSEIRYLNGYEGIDLIKRGAKERLFSALCKKVEVGQSVPGFTIRESDDWESLLDCWRGGMRVYRLYLQWRVE